LKAQNETILIEFVERRLCLGGLQMCKKEDLLLLPLMLFTLQAIASSSMGEEEMVSEGNCRRPMLLQ
jgi:hypothetical protein